MIIAAAIQQQGFSAVSVEEATTPAVLRNNGYSAQTAELVTVSKERANGREYYTNDEEAYRNQNKFVRFWRKLYVYMDPAAEDYSYYHHDTDTTPSYTDL